MTSESIKPFRVTQNWTRFPNPAFKYVMPEVNGGTWKIICVAIRETFGWHKEQARLTYGDFMEKTGLHKEAVRNGIEEALKKDYLIREPDGKSFLYSLNVEYEHRFENRTDNSSKIEPVEGGSIKDKKDSINSNFVRTVETDPSTDEIDPLFSDLISVSEGEGDQEKEKGKKKKSGRDPRLDHPAIKTYRHFARLYVPINWRDRVIEAVGDQAEDWGKLVDAWVGLGWNPANVRGMVEAWNDLGWDGFKKEYSGGPSGKKDSGRSKGQGLLGDPPEQRSEQDEDIDEETLDEIRKVARRENGD